MRAVEPSKNEDFARRRRPAAYALHANGYLIKPLGEAQFAIMIEALATYRLKWNYP